MEEKIYTGKSYEEAVNNAMLDMPGVTKDEVEVVVLEEGKKKLFGSTKWKIKVTERKSDALRAVNFIEGLLKIMGVEGECAVVSEDESIKIDIKTPQGAKVIGKRGDVLDAIQSMAGAVANIGREKYIKVVVDCENYRSQREAKLVELAHKVEAKAQETGRKIILEPMNPYERRIIHSALVESTTVKTSSEGREPNRYVVVIPNDAQPGDRGIRYGERHERGGRGDRGGRDRHERRGRDRGERRDRGDRGERRGGGKPSSGGARRGKKEIVFGTFLGNSGAGKKED